MLPRNKLTLPNQIYRSTHKILITMICIPYNNDKQTFYLLERMLFTLISLNTIITIHSDLLFISFTEYPISVHIPSQYIPHISTYPISVHTWAMSFLAAQQEHNDEDDSNEDSDSYTKSHIHRYIIIWDLTSY